ncbi:MAG: MFS transporter [Oscillospiraceae bacterium]|jgi:MFS family permease|nr:MFS transporter [Oscillospiraceae bacterium]
MKLTREKKLLLITLLAIALVQMPQQSLSPAIEKVAREFGLGLATVQEAFALVNIFLPASGVLTAFLIGRGLLSKRAAIIGGLSALGATAVCAPFLHTEFWHIRLLSALLGVSVGAFLVNATSLMFDSYTERERETIAGFQTSFVNGGGILLSLVGGALAATIWYGCYFVLLLGFPIAALAIFTVPKRPAAGAASRKSTRLPGKVYYYSAVLFVFMILFNTCGMNISTHLAQAGYASPALAGAAVAVQMAGGALAGFAFGRLSSKLGDYVMTLGCGTLALGLAIAGAFHASLAAAFLGVFLAGTAMSLLAPRTVFAVSGLTDETNSSLASSISQSVAPSLGGFLTPYLITRPTELLSSSTASRYLITAALSAAFGAALALVTRARFRRG